MALNTQIRRDDQPLSIRWGWWHVQCMAVARAIEDEVVTETEVESITKMESALETHRDIIKEFSFVIDSFDDLANAINSVTSVFWDKVYKHFWSAEWFDGFTLTREFSFTDPTDGEVLELKKGDVLWANI